VCQLIGWSSVVTLTLIFIGACRSPEPRRGESVSPELDGAWQRTFSETIGPDGSRYPGRTHESFLLISDGFYGMNWAFGAEASDFYADRFSPTDDEKLARYEAMCCVARPMARRERSRCSAAGTPERADGAFDGVMLLTGCGPPDTPFSI
jgi:hypothetical protein